VDVDRGDQLGAVARLGDDLDPATRLQQHPKATAEQRLVIREYEPHR
jgi:hypothetical protein